MSQAEMFGQFRHQRTKAPSLSIHIRPPSLTLECISCQMKINRFKVVRIFYRTFNYLEQRHRKEVALKFTPRMRAKQRTVNRTGNESNEKMKGNVLGEPRSHSWKHVNGNTRLRLCVARQKTPNGRTKRKCILNVAVMHFKSQRKIM